MNVQGGNPLETELNTYRTIQKEIGKVQNQVSTAQTQILENEMVLKELDLLEEDASVFKLIGPVLVKQELVEVKNNVTKRVEFIKNDMCVRLPRARRRPLTLTRALPCPVARTCAARGWRG